MLLQDRKIFVKVIPYENVLLYGSLVTNDAELHLYRN